MFFCVIFCISKSSTSQRWADTLTGSMAHGTSMPRLAPKGPALGAQFQFQSRGLTCPVGISGGGTWSHGSSVHRGKVPREISQIHTSSTAQGGGGSFKNRKPIGEIGCCESGMAERIH